MNRSFHISRIYLEILLSFVLMEKRQKFKTINELCACSLHNWFKSLHLKSHVLMLKHFFPAVEAQANKICEIYANNVQIGCDLNYEIEWTRIGSTWNHIQQHDTRFRIRLNLLYWYIAWMKESGMFLHSSNHWNDLNIDDGIDVLSNPVHCSIEFLFSLFQQFYYHNNL